MSKSWFYSTKEPEFNKPNSQWRERSDASVSYTSDGRIDRGLGQSTYPKANSARENDNDDFRSYDPRRDHRRLAEIANMSGDWRQKALAYKKFTDEKRMKRISPKEEESFSSVFTLQYVTGVLFVVSSILILIFGVINAICDTTHAAYTRFWSGIFILEFGIISVIYKDAMESYVKNVLFIILGMLGLVMAFIGSAFVMNDLTDRLKSINMVGGLDSFIKQLNETVTRDKPAADNLKVEVEVRLGLANDIITAILFLIAYFILPCLCLIGNKMWKVYMTINHKSGPFCRPVFLNPWGQMLLAEILIFTGLLTGIGCIDTDNFEIDLLNSQRTERDLLNPDIEYRKVFAPVWTGLIVCLAGLSSSIAAKDPENDTYVIVSIAMEVLALISSIISIVVITLGMSYNIEAISLNKSLTGYIRDEIVASSCLYAVADAVMIVSIFYAFGLLTRSVNWKRKMVRRSQPSRFPYNNFANEHTANRFGNFNGPKVPPYHYNYALD